MVEVKFQDKIERVFADPSHCSYAMASEILKQQKLVITGWDRTVTDKPQLQRFEWTDAYNTTWVIHLPADLMGITAMSDREFSYLAQQGGQLTIPSHLWGNQKRMAPRDNRNGNKKTTFAPAFKTVPVATKTFIEWWKNRIERMTTPMVGRVQRPDEWMFAVAAVGPYGKLIEKRPDLFAAEKEVPIHDNNEEEE